jgi:rhodanese-related sulfurtransferase
MAAQNQEEGLVAQAPLEPLAGLWIVDVRHEAERDARPLTEVASSTVPLEGLRHAQLDNHDAPLVTVCERGARAAEAARFLSARYLGGGLRWRDALGWGQRR